MMSSTKLSPKPSFSPFYHQALSDFGINTLLDQIQQLIPENDAKLKIEQLAKLFIQQLTYSLSYDWIDAYLHVIEKGQSEAISRLLSCHQHLPLPCDTPSFFLDASQPMYAMGTVVRWRLLDDSEVTDWGIVIGRFYGYAPVNGRWMWCYLILLDLDSPSASWCLVDTAWELDLEGFNDE